MVKKDRPEDLVSQSKRKFQQLHEEELRIGKNGIEKGVIKCQDLI